ncbi:MAG: UvrD-helicase domain-containing protein [Duncaniella sp.]|nr:UvrD-helicase domain-containing protein [Duncaniella sp.]
MSETSYLDQLNPQQRDAVSYCDGPQLVIAGAGSGKTRVLTYKIVHLLRLGYKPWNILALTFTNKAAAEMRDRIETLIGARDAGMLWMGTFHSIFARILRRYADRIGFKSSFTIYDTADSRSLIKTIIKDLELDDKIYKDSAILSAISNAKNALISPAAYMADSEIQKIDRQAHRERLGEIYSIYTQRCRIAGAMDFDDLLYYTNVLLRDNRDVLDDLRRSFTYILVDEYQDTNFAQHLIVNMLAAENKRLCVVGDDAQSIYSFRGANIRNILDLNRSLPELKIFKLEQNYRSTQNIIKAAGSLIEKNREQLEKQVFSRNDPGPKVEVVRCYSDFEEGYVVANRLVQVNMDSASGLNECAILYRTNAQSRIIEEALRKRNIPYRIYGGLSFYQRKEVKDAIAYFRLVLNPDDDEALRRVINTPKRSIGDTTVRKLSAAAMAAGVSMGTIIADPEKFDTGLTAATLKKLSAFARILDRATLLNREGADAFTVAQAIIHDSKLLEVLIHDRTPESISKQENLNELMSGIRAHVDEQREQEEGDTSLGSFMAEVSLATDQDSDDTADQQRVTLMTVHSAKGLEFDNVFIVGVEEDLFPSIMSSDTPQGIEEERRLMYVAITRARKFCMLTYAATRYRNGLTQSMRPSRFIGDIDPKFLRLQTGRDFPATPSVNRRTEHRTSFAPSMQGSAQSLNEIRSPRIATAENPLTSRPKIDAAADYSLHTSAEVSPGTIILHSRFGKGEVLDLPDTDRMVVAFENDSTPSRTLLFKFAKIAILK